MLGVVKTAVVWGVMLGVTMVAFAAVIQALFGWAVEENLWVEHWRAPLMVGGIAAFGGLIAGAGYQWDVERGKTRP